MNHRTAYRSALALAIATALFLVWSVGALGVIGAEGDRADLMYAGVLAIAVVGAAVARLRPSGMARAMLAAALAHGVVTAIALIAGKQRSPVSSVAEIVGLNAMFAALFVGSALLFRRAAGAESSDRSGPTTA